MPVPPGTTLDPTRTHSAILDAATDMLYQRGLDGIGVAELCSRLGISKQTLYRHFGSRDGLVKAVLEARSDRVVTWLHDVVAAAGDDPEAQVEAVFDALHCWYNEPGFRGCAIVNAAVQHHSGAARAIAARHLNRHLDLLTTIAQRAFADDPRTLGRQLLMLLEGATVVADHHDADDTGRQAKDAAPARPLRGGPCRRTSGTGRPIVAVLTRRAGGIWEPVIGLAQCTGGCRWGIHAAR